MSQLLTAEQQKQVARLRFPGELEADFWLDWAEKIRRPAGTICKAGIVLCATFLTASYFLLGADGWGANLRSVAAVFPILILTLVLARTSQIWVKVNALLLWMAIASMAIVNGYAMLAREETIYERAVISNWLFFAVVVIGSGLALVRSSGVSVLILLGTYYWFTVWLRPLGEPARTSNWMILMQTAFFALAAAYVAEVRARREFLLGHLLEEERRKSDDLLLNVLPEEIARRLKARPGVLAERHDDASVLFADIVDFTPFASSRDADEVVGFLDEVFTRFDDLVQRRGLEKIKTVGDAYMVAGGVIDSRPDHLESMADLALEFQEAARRSGVQMRIGIHCGPLVAGVIGRRKFLYDLWGETVNTASRMESHGLPDRIQVTRAIADRLADKFHCEHRGEVEVKGVGRIETCFVVGALPRPASKRQLVPEPTA
ncbi:MAG TPA: adenylate/guanylate cyclase domain-containing protein [Fimbriimonadaceae bacterium]|nr:adenylate/guanylate cyclase domain-containing protein [Fimbriimonadaceae bacterium]